MLVSGTTWCVPYDLASDVLDNLPLYQQSVGVSGTGSQMKEKFYDSHVRNCFLLRFTKYLEHLVHIAIHEASKGQRGKESQSQSDSLDP